MTLLKSDFICSEYIVVCVTLQVKTWPTWGCEKSSFPWSYSETETCYILKGKAIIIPKDGTASVEIGVGDLCTFPEGLSCTWDVKEPILKHYYFN